MCFVDSSYEKTNNHSCPINHDCINFGAGANALGGSTTSNAPNGSELKLLASYSTGSGIAGAEISAVDAKSKRLFITNGKTNSIEIVDIANAKSQN